MIEFNTLIGEKKRIRAKYVQQLLSYEQGTQVFTLLFRVRISIVKVLWFLVNKQNILKTISMIIWVIFIFTAQNNY